MNDKFRFRVWNEKERKFILDHNHPIGSDYFLALDTEGKLLKIGMGDLNEEKQCSWGNIEEYQGIVEQCTGLKDKNGRLIFEGDFFRPNIAKEKEKVFGIITFGKYDDFSQSLGFYVKWKGYPAEETEHGYKGWRKDLIFWLKRGELEIIGNLHENADLLKEKSEKPIL